MLEQLSLFPSAPAPRAIHRVFLAALPDAEATRRFSAAVTVLSLRHRLRGRFVSTGCFHVSLHGLGSHAGVPAGLVDRVDRAVESLGIAPFAVTFDQVGCFGGQPGNWPLVLFGGEGAVGLTALYEELGRALQVARFARRVRAAYTPHLTFFRGDFDIAEPIEPITWTVREFVLVDSLIGRGRHIHLARWPLRG